MQDIFRVLFEDGVQYPASSARINAGNKSLQIGSEVSARYSDGQWYPAKILSLPGKTIISFALSHLDILKVTSYIKIYFHLVAMVGDRFLEIEMLVDIR